MPKEFYKFSRKYISEKGEFEDFYGALPDKLTIQKYEAGRNPLPVGDHNTIFKEVKLKKYRPTFKEHLLTKELGKITPEGGDWMRNIYNTLKDVIYKTWGNDFHVVGHSGGHDSRIISTIIKELREEHGDDWLGKILFVENGGEGIEFHKIMENQGWGKSQYMVYNEGANPRDYHAYSFNFKDAYQKFNGISGFPYNQWWDSYDHLQKLGVLPEHFQAYSGYGAYIEGMVHAVGDLTKITSAHFFKYNYYYQLATFRLKGDWVYPWWSYDYIKEMVRMRDIQKQRHRVSDYISQYYTSSSNIKRPTIPQVEKRGYRTVSDNLMKKIVKDYDNSWYGKKFEAKPNNYIYYSDWWTHWCAASICEHLIERGYDIR